MITLSYLSQISDFPIGILSFLVAFNKQVMVSALVSYLPFQLQSLREFQNFCIPLFVFIGRGFWVR